MDDDEHGRRPDDETRRSRGREFHTVEVAEDRARDAAAGFAYYDRLDAEAAAQLAEAVARKGRYDKMAELTGWDADALAALDEDHDPLTNYDNDSSRAGMDPRIFSHDEHADEYRPPRRNR